MFSLDQIRKRVEFYAEGAETSELLRLIFPRTEMEKLRLLDNLTYLELVNLKKKDFMSMGFSIVTADKLEKMMLFFKRLRYSEARMEYIRSPEEAYHFFSFLDTRLVEEFWVCFLNTNGKVVKKKQLFIGCLNSTVVHPREVFREAVKLPCSSILVVHNHPSGSPVPSEEDIEITNRLKEGGRILGIECADHIIIGRNEYTSMKELGYL
ncbi:DNA repair protein RadC [Siminovitchia acidinfaciens]|uniref:DNA repair protein RadC n=1 Tax=Siminovitchia acidinfaciens TaxID=2321395 RepID=A0A429Y449_9BACI|nr:DNA repair protein RadC [Siminovitchia acidinfaciens]RST76168.1 DNA repair protein RadC [Siminovitchia acidinfaciens]